MGLYAFMKIPCLVGFQVDIFPKLNPHVLNFQDPANMSKALQSWTNPAEIISRDAENILSQTTPALTNDKFH